MRYTTLIRNLVKAASETRVAGQDLASRLSQRFQGEQDVIRQCLFHAVCDPRFMLHVDGSVKWTTQAKKHLEAFVTKLMHIDELTTEIAFGLLNEFLNEWFMLMMNELETNDKEFAPDSGKGEDENQRLGGKLKNTLDLFMKQIDPQSQENEEEEEELWKGIFPDLNSEEESEEEEGKDENKEKDGIGDKQGKFGDAIESEENDNGTEEEEKEENVGNREEGEEGEGEDGDEDEDGEGENEEGEGNWEEQKESEVSGKHNRGSDKNAGKRLEEEEVKKEEEEKEENGGNEEENQDENMNPRFGRGGGKGERKKIENRFLKKLPPSLVELVKRIGRTGDDVFETSGSFPIASKSDITGITVGNDLNSVLPSELALLAHPNTENIFLNKFVSKKLQVFASASSGKAGKKEGNGPIIICLDTSGSMYGEPIIVAKALTMAISIIAQRQKRKVILVKYADSYEGMVINKFSRQSGEVKAFLNEFESGGNNESKMFNWLFNEILPSVENDFESADILCITDFGWTRIHTDVIKVIQEYKNQGMRWYGLNIHPDIFTLDEDSQCIQLIDSMWNYNEGKCIEVKN